MSNAGMIVVEGKEEFSQPNPVGCSLDFNFNWTDGLGGHCGCNPLISELNWVWLTTGPEHVSSLSHYIFHFLPFQNCSMELG